MARGLSNPNKGPMMKSKGKGKNKASKARKNGSKQNRSRPGPSRPNPTTLINNSGFLKCALASIDFQDTGFSGIPDAYSGKVFAEHWDGVKTVTVDAGKTSLFLLTPTPGIAYFNLDNTNGTSYDGTFAPNNYPDFATLFASSIGQLPVSEFRMVSNCFEMTNTTPSMYRGGDIKVAELDLQILNPISGTAYGTPDNVYYYVEGFPYSPLTSGLYIGGGSSGIYTGAYNRNASWEWYPPMEYGTHGSDHGLFPLSWLDSSSPPLIKSSLNQDSIRGWCNNFASKLIIVTAPITQAQTFVIRTKQCVEFRPTPGTMYSRIASLSPPHSPAELQLYAQTVKSLPTAVSRRQNDNFWSKVKRFAGQAFKVLEKTVTIGAAIAPLL